MSQLQRQPSPSGLVDVLDVLLDKGLVIDVYLRVSLVGIELLTVDARIVVASVDTYLRFAEAVNRLDLTQAGDQKTLPDLFGDMQEKGAGRKTKGVLEGAKNALFGGDDDDDSNASSGRSGSGARSSSSGSSRKSSSRARKSSSGGRKRTSSGSRGR
jgi:hypothetical protein